MRKRSLHGANEHFEPIFNAVMRRPRIFQKPAGERGQGRTQGRRNLSANLDRVHEAAKRSRRTQFTALLHHVTVEAFQKGVQTPAAIGSAWSRWDDG